MKKRLMFWGIATAMLGTIGGMSFNNSFSQGGLVAHAAKAKYTGKSGGIKQYKVSGNVLSGVTSKGFKTVNVSKKYMAGKVGKYDSGASYASWMKPGADHIQTTANVIKSSAHKGAAYSFKTAAFLPLLPKSSPLYDYIRTPQAAAFSKNGKELFVVYTKGGTTSDWSKNKQGFVVKYDWSKIKNKGIDLRSTSTYNSIKKYIHIGPTFATGHGQQFALNPKTNELWLTRDRTAGKILMERINQSSLKPDQAITFSMGKQQMGAQLTFDKNGYAYWSNVTAKAWSNCPKGTMKFYRGKIGTGSTYFKMVKRGIRYAPGATVQSMGYNPVKNRVYVVADNGITSIAANKFDKLSAKDIDQNKFSGSREFEGLVFDPTNKSAKNGYLLSNRGPELLKMY